MAFKKGDVSITFLVTLSLAIIVLIVVGLSFMSKTKWLIEKEETVTTTVLDDAAKNIAIEKCKLFCSIGNKDSYNNPEFAPEVREAGFTTCSDFEDLDDFETECRECKGASRDTCVGKAQADCTGVCTWDTTTTKCKMTNPLKACAEYKTESECKIVSGCRWE